MMAAAPSRSSMPQAAATSPNGRWRVRSGRISRSRASSRASISAAVPRYRSEVIFGLPSTQPISRRYQYGFPLITFLYRLGIALGHRAFQDQIQGDTPEMPRSGPGRRADQDIKINLTGKLRLGPLRYSLRWLPVLTGPRRRSVAAGGPIESALLDARRHPCRHRRRGRRAERGGRPRRDLAGG